MKRRLDPASLEAFQDRGTAREPDGLWRYRTGEAGHSRTGSAFPHGRFCLWMELHCPKLREAPREDARYDAVELRVGRFYRGVLPWLLSGQLAPDKAQRLVDFVDLVDELMDRESDLYACGAPWPLRDVLGLFRDAVDALSREPNPYASEDWDDELYEEVREAFSASLAELAAHEACCDEVLVNVHWW